MSVGQLEVHVIDVLTNLFSYVFSKHPITTESGVIPTFQLKF